MKNQIIALLVLMPAALSLFAQDPSALKGPYLGQEPPGDSSVVFAPGFVSTEAGELNAVFCCDGNEFYFSRRGVPGKESALMVTKQVHDVWTEPQVLKFSGIFSDIDLFITSDGKSLIFCSRRPFIDGEYEKAVHDLWMSTRTGNEWSIPKPFATEAMSDAEDFYPVITAGGNLYFNSQRGGPASNNIYCSRFVDEKYTEAERLPPPVNSDHWEFDAFVSQNEQMIVFSSTRPGGYGGADIYVSQKGPDGSWSEPQNLGPSVNSAAFEYGASLSPDGKYFFYTSTRNGSENIFWISARVLDLDPADSPPPDAVDYGQIFMNHLRKNWDDIHDVIMRYHYEDPWLNGRAVINMTWAQGRLREAEILENTTGEPGFGNDLITAMKDWEIQELSGTWSSALPIRTSIKGSDQPDFGEYGIITGKITDTEGNPVQGATVSILSGVTGSEVPDTRSNREGIFILTLIPPGTWQMTVSKEGHEPVMINDISIEKGKHCNRDVTMK